MFSKLTLPPPPAPCPLPPAPCPLPLGPCPPPPPKKTKKTQIFPQTPRTSKRNNITNEHRVMHENFIFLADFDRNIKDSPMKEFYEMNNLLCLINKPQCFRNPTKPTEPIYNDMANKA